ncbi:MAG: heme-binding protein [Candidatus Moraniibacteriota bacterium]
MPLNCLTISQAEARKLIDKVIELAIEDHGKPIATAVVGSHGRLVEFSAMDGVMPASIAVAQNKAYTAIMGNRDTSEWDERNPPIKIANLTDNRFTFFPGGILIEHDDTVIGALGVSGRTGTEDRQLAETAYNEIDFYGLQKEES